MNENSTLKIIALALVAFIFIKTFIDVQKLKKQLENNDVSVAYEDYNHIEQIQARLHEYILETKPELTEDEIIETVMYITE